MSLASSSERGSGEGSVFRKELGLLDCTMIVVGSMIGSGIFLVSADIARTVGCAGYLLIVWLVTGIVTVIAGLSYGELAGMMPEAGGQYVYLREAYNPLIGFLYGWTLFLVIQTGSIAAVAVAFAKFSSVLVPWLGEKNILFSAGRFKVSASQLLAIVSIMFLSYINSRGIREGKIVQNIFTIIKASALFLLILLGIFVGKNATAISSNFSNFWNASWTHLSDGGISFIESLSGFKLVSAIGVAMVGSLFASDAWNNITFTASEVKDSSRNIPLSLVLGTGIVTLLYIATNISYILVLPVVGDMNAGDVFGRGIQFAEYDRVGTAAAYMIFGPPAELIMAIFIMVSTFGCNNGMILTGARVYYAMARDGLFFRSIGKLNRKAVPSLSLFVQGIWASILCLSGTYSDLLDYVIFAVLIFYILSVAGIFILRKKRPDAKRPYKTWGYPYLPALYIVAGSGICIDLLIFKPRYTWPGLIIVFLGIPVYFIWKNVFQKRSVQVNG